MNPSDGAAAANNGQFLFSKSFDTSHSAVIACSSTCSTLNIIQNCSESTKDAVVICFNFQKPVLIKIIPHIGQLFMIINYIMRLQCSLSELLSILLLHFEDILNMWQNFSPTHE